MKKLNYLILLTTIVGGLMATQSQAAIILGDVLVFDIGKTPAGGGAETVGNWNNMSSGGGGIGQNSVAAITDAIRLSDGAGTGVGLRILAQEADKAGIGGADVGAPATTSSLAFPTSGLIPTTALQDVGYFSHEDLDGSGSSGGSADSNNGLLLTGLNDNLLYNISWISSINAARNTLTWTVGGTTFNIDPEDNTTIYTAMNVSSSNGEILIDIDISQEGDPGFVSSDVAHINALEVVASIPEPASAGLLGLAAVALFTRRRRQA